MSSLFKRPLALWIAQVLLVCFGLIFLAPTFLGFLLLFTGDLGLVWGVQVLQRAFIGLPSAFGCFFSVWAISKRKSWGRWLGIISILMILAVILGLEVWSKLANGNTNTSEVTITYLYSLVPLIAPFALTIALLTLGKRVNAYFSVKPEYGTERIDPPPPPTFKY